MEKKITNIMTHLKTIAIMLGIIGFMALIPAWPYLMLKILTTASVILAISIVYIGLYCAIKDKESRDKHGIN
jgi:flagellar biosynthesis component FlhA